MKWVLLLAFLIGGPLAACDALGVLGANGERPTAPDLARIYSLALDLAQQMPSYRDDQLHELLQAPLVPHPEFSSELKQLWRELASAVERVDGVSHDQVLDLFRQSLRERLGLRAEGYEKREELREAKLTFTPAVANWTDPMTNPTDFLDRSTGIVHELPFAPAKDGQHWRTERSEPGWVLVSRAWSAGAHFWNPSRGLVVEAQTPFWKTSGLRAILRQVTPSELSFSVTPDGKRAAVTSMQLVKYPLRYAIYRSQTAVYDPATGKQLHVWKHRHPAQITKAVISADGKDVWLALDRTVYRWNLETDRTDTFDLGPQVRVGTDLARPVDGIVGVRWKSVFHVHVGVLDLQTGQLKHVFQSSDHHAKFSDDGLWFLEEVADATATKRSRMLKLTHLPTGKQRRIITDKPMDMSGAISSDGKQIWLYTGEKRRVGYDLETFWQGGDSGLEVPK